MGAQKSILRAHLRNPRNLWLKLLPSVGDLAASPAGEVFRLREEVERLVQLRITIEQHAAGIPHTKLVVEDLVFDIAFDVVAVVLEVLLRELDSTLRDVLFELIDQRIGNLERRLVNRRVLREEVPDKCIHSKFSP